MIRPRQIASRWGLDPSALPGDGDERHASWLELFFDLVFVVAIAELSHELVVNHTLNGFAIFAALFVLRNLRPDAHRRPKQSAE